MAAGFVTQQAFQLSVAAANLGQFSQIQLVFRT